jgi:phage/plasmid-like protein (TIGR03299 family)
MAHGISDRDWMVSGRGEVPWHGIGTVVDGAMTSREALDLARLDWKVIQTPIYTEGAVLVASATQCEPNAIKGFVANVRSDTSEVLGVVSDKYVPCQNVDIFNFADSLVGVDGGDARYDTAGSLWGGKKVWVLLNLPSEDILGDEVGSYLAVVNYNDGSGALRAFNCATRIVCNNTLSVALKEGKRSVSIRHMSTMSARRNEAVRAVNGQRSYFRALRNFAEAVVGKKVDAEVLLSKLFPVPVDASNRVRENINMTRYIVSGLFNDKDDLQNFRGTGWGFYNAVSDWYSHKIPFRQTATYSENRLSEYFEGCDVLERVRDLVLVA